MDGMIVLVHTLVGWLVRQQHAASAAPCVLCAVDTKQAHITHSLCVHILSYTFHLLWCMAAREAATVSLITLVDEDVLSYSKSSTRSLCFSLRFFFLFACPFSYFHYFQFILSLISCQPSEYKLIPYSKQKSLLAVHTTTTVISMQCLCVCLCAPRAYSCSLLHIAN